jgi:methionine synthase I (cobalamin-dependent)
MPATGTIAELLEAGPVLLDGGWGTQLQARGLRPGENPDFWNLEHPDRVEEVARSYVEAGSRIILTNTFRANRIALARDPRVDRVVDVNRAGVEISRRAAGDRAHVFASIGPSGKQLIIREVDPEGLRATFGEQADALASGKPDGIVIETMSDLAEAKLAIEAAKATGLPVVACMAFDSGKKRDRTMMGVAPAQAAEELTAAGADVVGANCGAGMDEYIPVCAGLAAATDRPIWIKPNAGIPQLRGDEVVYPTTAEEFAGKLPALLEAGASFVGGCCGTDPSFIVAMGRALAG